MDIETSATRPRDREGAPGEAFAATTVGENSATKWALLSAMVYARRQVAAIARETADPAAVAVEQHCAEAEIALRQDGHSPETANVVRTAARGAVRTTGDRTAFLGTLVLLDMLVGRQSDVAALIVEIEEATR